MTGKSSSFQHCARWAVSMLAAAIVAAGLAVGAAPPTAEAAPTQVYLNTYIPPDLDYSAINSADYSHAFNINLQLPARLDLRSTVGPVRDQTTSGDCWSFAATASASSSLAANGQAGPELSTVHLDNAVYNELGLYRYGNRPADFTRDGGNAIMAAAALAKGYGAQTAQAYPRTNLAARFTMSQINTTAYRLENMLAFPAPRDANRVYRSANVAAVKQALVQYGALFTGYYADEGQTGNSASEAYNPTTSAYYYPDIKGAAWNNGSYRANHAVTLVGYDDAYPAANFELARRATGLGWFRIVGEPAGATAVISGYPIMTTQWSPAIILMPLIRG
jgi:C1A family cysteine protease